MLLYGMVREPEFKLAENVHAECLALGAINDDQEHCRPPLQESYLLSSTARSSTWRGKPITNETMNKQSAITAGSVLSVERARVSSLR